MHQIAWHCRRVERIDGLPQITAGNADRLREIVKRFGLIRRHFGPDRALIAIDIEQTAVKDRICDASGPCEMDVAGESLPRLVYEATAFIGKAATILIHHDAVRVHQHDGGGALTARIDRFDVHAVPVAGDICTAIHRDADAVASVESCSR